MASQNIHLYDDVKQDWYKIMLESDFTDLISSMNNNELQLIPSEQGSRGLRYWNNKLEYSVDNGITWTEIQTGGSGTPSEISDINGLQTALDSKVDDSELISVQQDITDIQSELATTVKSVNGELPDASGNVTITSGSSQELDNHIADTNNPHNVTASQIGLENVDNTSDLDKPISTATQTALDSKFDSDDIIPIQQSIADLETAVASKGDVKTVNGITPDVNGNVEIQTSGGTSITVEDILTSNSTTNALSANMGRELKDELDTHTSDADIHVTLTDKSKWDAKADSTLATTTNDGLLSKEDKGKLDGLNNNIINDTLTSTSVTESLSANQGRVLKELIDTKTSLPISADDVTDTTSRVMVSPNQRGQIDANTADITSHSQRISTLETTVGNMITTDEMVKMNSTDTSGYLEDKLDGTTIQNINNKIVATGLDGLTSTIYELNLLTGATSNIQAQINALASVGNFSTSLNTYADLLAMSGMNSRDMVIVLEDETKDNASTIYIYNGVDWNYTGEFKGGEVRDFTTNPINLEIETTGVLPKTKYEKQDASETSVLDSDNNFTSTNVEGVLKELNSKIDASQQTVIVNDTLTSTSATEALSANMGRKLDENLTSHESKLDVVNEKGHVQIDDVTIKLNADGKIYSVGGGTSTNNADDIVESSTRVFVSPTEKTAITHANREVIDKFSESTDGKLLFNGTEVGGITDEDIEHIEELISNHEDKKVSDSEGVHGLRINRNKIMFKDENDVWTEFDTASSILPTAKSLIGTSSADGTSITINWVNPNNEEYVKSELYVSKTDITNLDVEDLTGIASMVVDDNSTTTYTQATNYGEVYYFKVYTYHDVLGEEKYSNPITISVRSEDKEPPSTVSNVKIESLDGSLKITWTNPPESDLGNVRLNYSTSDINDINDGTMAFNGTGNTVTITGLTNGVPYNLRFFTIDNTGNINNDERMVYTATPKIPSTTLRYYDTLTNIGTTETIDGAAYNEAGYFGTVPASELFTGSELASEVGITEGVSQNEDVHWYKFYIDGRILFCPSKTIRHSISWDALNISGSVFGETTLSKSGVNFKVRLFRGALTNPSKDSNADKGAHYSEWNRLILPLSTSNPPKNSDFTYTTQVESDIATWGTLIQRNDLINSGGTGRMVWCQESVESNSGSRVARGNLDVSGSLTYPSTTKNNYNGWLPVLEVVNPEELGGI